jgi:large subunit ribosomal protein L21
VKVGKPAVAGASVAAEVLDQEMGDKIYIQKMRRRKNFRRRTGHRQKYTRVRIGAITA